MGAGVATAATALLVAGGVTLFSPVALAAATVAGVAMAAHGAIRLKSAGSADTTTTTTSATSPPTSPPGEAAAAPVAL
jgi:hypothetical protein